MNSLKLAALGALPTAGLATAAAAQPQVDHQPAPQESSQSQESSHEHGTMQGEMSGLEGDMRGMDGDMSGMMAMMNNPEMRAEMMAMMNDPEMRAQMMDMMRNCSEMMRMKQEQTSDEEAG